jgi:hypothetical protein
MVHHLPLGNPIANKINYTFAVVADATCNRRFQLAARLDRLRGMAQLYVGKRAISKGIGGGIRRFMVFACHAPSLRTLAVTRATRVNW